MKKTATGFSPSPLSPTKSSCTQTTPTPNLGDPSFPRPFFLPMPRYVIFAACSAHGHKTSPGSRVRLSARTLPGCSLHSPSPAWNWLNFEVIGKDSRHKPASHCLKHSIPRGGEGQTASFA